MMARTPKSEAKQEPEKPPDPDVKATTEGPPEASQRDYFTDMITGYMVPPNPVKCAIDGNVWHREQGPPPCEHTQAEWDNYKSTNSLSDPYPRWIDMPPAKT